MTKTQEYEKKINVYRILFESVHKPNLGIASLAVISGLVENSIVDHLKPWYTKEICKIMISLFYISQISKAGEWCWNLTVSDFYNIITQSPQQLWDLAIGLERFSSLWDFVI